MEWDHLLPASIVCAAEKGERQEVPFPLSSLLTKIEATRSVAKLTSAFLFVWVTFYFKHIPSEPASLLINLQRGKFQSCHNAEVMFTLVILHN